MVFYEDNLYMFHVISKCESYFYRFCSKDFKWILLYAVDYYCIVDNLRYVSCGEAYDYIDKCKLVDKLTK